MECSYLSVKEYTWLSAELSAWRLVNLDKNVR
jgi:hypothetical protein